MITLTKTFNKADYNSIWSFVIEIKRMGTNTKFSAQDLTGS